MWKNRLHGNGNIRIGIAAQDERSSRERWNIRAVRQDEEPASGTHPAGYPRRHQKEDVLSIETLQKVAVELGTNLAGIINIFNPEMLVIGGDLSVTGAYLTQPICMGIKKFSLNMVNEDSQVAASTLKEHAGLIGACLMARSKYLNN